MKTYSSCSLKHHSVDLDIEGGSTEYYANFVDQLRSHMDGASKQSVIFDAHKAPTLTL